MSFFTLSHRTSLPSRHVRHVRACIPLREVGLSVKLFSSSRARINSRMSRCNQWRLCARIPSFTTARHRNPADCACNLCVHKNQTWRGNKLREAVWSREVNRRLADIISCALDTLEHAVCPPVRHEPHTGSILRRWLGRSFRRELKRGAIFTL